MKFVPVRGLHDPPLVPHEQSRRPSRPAAYFLVSEDVRSFCCYSRSVVGHEGRIEPTLIVAAVAAFAMSLWPSMRAQCIVCPSQRLALDHAL